jgi:hypothetical protein
MVKRLKDYTWQINGEFPFKDSSLLNPTFEVLLVVYSPRDLMARITLEFREGNFPHTEDYELFITGDNEGIDATNVVDLISILIPEAKIIQ